MLIAACPECGERVTVPTMLDGTARVACPMCQSEYRLDRLLAMLPPQLIVLERAAPSRQTATLPGPLPELATNPAHPIAELSVASAGSMPPLMESTEPVPSTFDFGAEEVASRFEATSIRPARRRSTAAGRNVAVEFAKIVFGGVAGLVIAQAILWWLPAAWRKDPLNLAPRLPGWLGFLAPAELRGPAAEIAPGDVEGSDANATGQIDLDADFSVPLPESGGAAAGGVSERASTLDGPTDSVPDRHSSSGASSGAIESGDAIPHSDAPIDQGEAAGENRPAVDQMIGFRDPPSFSSKQLRAGMTRFQDAFQAWNAVEQSQQVQHKEIVARLFHALYDLAWKVTFADSTDPETPSSLDQIDLVILRIGQDGATANLAGNAATRWLGIKNRASQGVLVPGVVKAVAPRGLFYVTRLELFGQQKPVVTLVAKHDPSSHMTRPYHVGDQLIVLGAISDDPSLDILGYETDESLVIWSGRWVVLPSRSEG